MIRHNEVVCCYCKQGEQGHRRDNGECMAFERADVKPYRLALARVPLTAKGWVTRG